MAVSIGVNELGAELRRRRDRSKLSLREVEGLTNISAATLSRIERGGKPDIDVIRRLAEWLGINVRAGGAEVEGIRTDEDLKRTIAVHLRANKKLPEKTARAIAESFEIIMQVEIQKARRKTLG